MMKFAWKDYKILVLYVIGLMVIIAVVDSGITSHFRSWLHVQIPNLDKVGHFFGMGFLAYLMLQSFSLANETKLVKKAVLIILSLLFLATTEEFSQRFLQYRSFQLWDLAANYLGILMFSNIFLLQKIKRLNNLLNN